MAKPVLHRDESLQVPWEKTSLKKNKHNQSKVKRRPSGLGAPLSWNPAHSIFTSVCVIYLFIYLCFQSAGRLHVVLVYAEWFPSWLKFRFGHRPYSAASHIQSDMLKKSSLKLHFFLSFFLSFIFLFVFLFFDNWECWNLLRLRFITTQTCLILQKKTGLRSSVYVGLG